MRRDARIQNARLVRFLPQSERTRRFFWPRNIGVPVLENVPQEPRCVPTGPSQETTAARVDHVLVSDTVKLAENLRGRRENRADGTAHPDGVVLDK